MNPSRFHLSALASALALSFICSTPIQAQYNNTNNQQELIDSADSIVVTATRTDKKLTETPASIAIISQKDIEELDASNFGEALELIPNVSVSDINTGYQTKISIRGSDYKQNIYLIDGMRQDYTSNTGSTPAGLFIDPEMLKQVEVKRGGGSVLYGNGGIGGVVSLTTKTAKDLLRPGENWGVLVKGGYNSGEDEFSESAFIYGQYQIWDLILGVNNRHGHEEELSNGQKEPDANETKAQSVMFKATMRPDESSETFFGYNFDKFDTDEYNRGSLINSKFKQHRFYGGFKINHSELLNLEGRLQFSKFDNHRHDVELPLLNEDTLYTTEVTLQNTSYLVLQGEHALTYGLDYSHSDQDSYTFNPKSSSSGGTDPARPNSKSQDFGLFIQDEYSPLEWLTFTPSARYSYYQRSSDNSKHANHSDGKLTAGLTTTIKPTKGMSFWATVASGYRPPNLDELYYEFDEIVFGPGLNMPFGQVKPNPNLKPEQSYHYEIGMNSDFTNLLHESDRFSSKIALFYDEIKDGLADKIIGSKPNPVNPEMPPILIHQLQNIDKMERKGIELQTQYNIGNFEALASYAYLSSKNKITDEDIAYTVPQSVNARIAYTFPKQFLTTWYRLEWSDKPKKGNEDNENLTDYTLHNIGFTWAPKIKDFWDFTLNAGVYNITDEKFKNYAPWGASTYSYGRNYRVWISGKF